MVSLIYIQREQTKKFLFLILFLEKKLKKTKNSNFTLLLLKINNIDENFPKKLRRRP